MSIILNQSPDNCQGKILSNGWHPVELKYNFANQTLIRFNNGREVESSCLRCQDTPCSKFLASEVEPVSIKQFPSDLNLDVCATGAISLAVDSNAPTIDNERCILCGACAIRCPVGAILIDPDKGAIVNDLPNEAFIEVGHSDIKKNLSDREKFVGLPSSGTLVVESDEIVNEIINRFQKLKKFVGDRFPIILTRNLLIGAGIGALISRKGGNYIRMDIIISFSDTEKGVVEVEFGQDSVLDAPRDILDDIAVLVSRYNWNLESTVAIIVSDVLPNRRSEYWHIIQDIANALGVRIGTLTIFALMICNWNRKVLKLEDCKSLLYIDRNSTSYREAVLDKLIGRNLDLNNTSHPQVDISK